MKIFFKLLALAVFVSSPAIASGVKYEEFTLKNGMRAIVIPNAKVPAACHMVWYKVGSSDDPEGKSGLAHFLEHLMFKGTKNHKAGEFGKMVYESGGNENAFTSSDYTGYFQCIPSSRLAMVMELEADRMTGLALDEKSVDSEREVIIEERRSRIDNNPASLLSEQMERELFLNHRYGRPNIGWMHEMKGLTREDALAFYKKYYRPDNAILVVGGDVETAKVKELAGKFYGSLPVSEKVERPALKEPPHIAPRRVSYSDPRVKQEQLARDYLAASQGYRMGEANPYALTVLARILGGGSVSRLYSSLVERRKLAVSAGAGYGDVAIGPAEFSVHALPAKGVRLEKLEAAIDAEIEKLLSGGVTDAELAAAKNALAASVIYEHDGLDEMANIFGSTLASGLPASYVTDWEKEIGKVTKEEVMKAAHETLDKKRSVTGYLLSEEGK